MKLQYLGTAAAEGMPGPFCTCETCRKAWENGGKDMRTRSQALVDDAILIDYPSDNLYHSYRFGLDLTKIRNIIITHVHQDHFYPQDLANLRKGFSLIPEDMPPFNLYGSEEVKEQTELYAQDAGDRLAVHILEPFKVYEIADHKVTPLKAVHGTQHPFIYLIEQDGRSLLYAHDTGLFSDETWDYLKKTRPHLDFVSMDCTEGDVEDIGYPDHMCIGRNRKLKAMLTECGLADGKTIFAVNHFSHNGVHVLYDEMTEAVKDDGFVVSYDGCVIEF